MRIAISGTHCTGKSTLIEDLAERLPRYETVQEPYYLLEEEGYEFPAMPSLEDFEEQLSRSIQELHDDRKNVIFDRCPLDFVAYALSCADSDAFDLDEWLPRIEEAVKTLDLIVFIPIESRVAVPRSQDSDLRFDVDEKLRDFLADNSLDLEIEVREVTGSRETRVAQVLEYLAKA